MEAPLPIRPHVIGDSLILKVSDQVEKQEVAPVAERAKSERKAVDNLKTAITHDKAITEALAKMPANNGGWSTSATAEYLSATIRPGRSKQTWRGYLSMLMTADSDTGQYYYADARKWENRK